MLPLRRLLARYPSLAALVVVAALVLRVTVPAGYMPVADAGRIVLAICDGSGAAKTMAMAMPDMKHHGEPGEAAKGKCAFADLAQAMTGGADPIQLAAAIAFILALALLVAARRAPRSAAFLRPPLRGPPSPV